MSEVSSRGEAGGCTTQPSNSLHKVAVCELSTTDSNALELERVWPASILSVTCCVSELPRLNRFSTTKHAFSTDVAVLRGRVSCNNPFGPRQQGLLPRECPGRKQGDPTVPGSCQGPSAFLGKRGAAAPGLRPQGFGRPASTGLAALRAGWRPHRGPHKGTPSSGVQTGDPWPLAPNQGPWGSPAKVSRPYPVFGLVAHDTEARAEHVPATDVAVLPGGALLPAPFGPHNRDLPHRSALAANGDPRVPGSTEEPPWIPPNQQSIHPLSE